MNQNPWRDIDRVQKPTLYKIMYAYITNKYMKVVCVISSKLRYMKIKTNAK